MAIAFWILAFIIVGSSIAVITLRNPLHSALALILNLTAVAGIFALLHAHFLAMVQIIVYAGAIMVLVVFVLMLLNVKQEPHGRTGFVLIGLSGLAGAVFLWAISLKLSLVDRFIAHAPLPAEGTVENVGRLLYTTYLFPFEAASVLIMAALLGAVMLAKRNYSKD